MRFTNRQIWQMAYPILISLLMEHLIGLTDTAYLGRVGEVELGASALAGVYYLAIFMLGFGFSIGVQIIIARRNGEKRYSDIGGIFLQGAMFLMLLAGGVFVISKLYSPIFLRSIIQSDLVYEATVSYMNWRIYGFFFSFIAVLFRAFYVGITYTRILTINSVVMVLTNIILNYVLIFGKFGFPQLGIAGAAIASSTAEAVSALFYILYTWIKIDWKKYGFSFNIKFHPKMLGRILSTSIWTMLQTFLSMSTWFLFFVSVEHLGERSLAVTNIVRSVSSLLFIVVNAFSSTAGSLTSNLMGASEQNAVPRLGMRITRMCFFCCLPILLLIALFPSEVLRIYTDNTGLIENAVPSLWVMLSSYLFFVPAMIWFTIVSGTGNTRQAFMLDLAALSIYVAYVLYVAIGLKADVAVCWTSAHVYAVFMLLFSFLYLKKSDWREKRL